MKLIRSTLVALTLVGMAGVAQAETSTGGEARQDCACGTTFDGGPIGFCFLGDFCSNLVACGPGGDCPAGTTCVVSTCCTVPSPDVCCEPCPGTPEDCANPEVCGTYTLVCQPVAGPVPTVSEWGLILMTGLLLAAGGFLIWRRRSAPAVA